MTLAPDAGFLGAAVPELALRSVSAMPFSKALDGRIVSLHGVWHLGKPTLASLSAPNFRHPGADVPLFRRLSTTWGVNRCDARSQSGPVL